MSDDLDETGDAMVDAGPPAKTEAGGEDDGPSAIHDIDIEVYAVLGTASMLVSQLLKIGRGAIIELDTGVGDPVDILANQHLIARGEVVVVDDHLAVSLTKIVK